MRPFQVRVSLAIGCLAAAGVVDATAQKNAPTQPSEPLPRGALARFGTGGFRSGSQFGIRSVTVLPGAKRFVTLHAFTLTLWDAQTGVPLRTATPAGPFRFERGAKRAPFSRVPLARSADGKTLAVLTEKGPYLGAADLSGPFTPVPLDKALASEGVTALAFATGTGPLVLLGAHGRVGTFFPGKDDRTRSVASGLRDGKFLAAGAGVAAVGNQASDGGTNQVVLLGLADRQVKQKIEVPILLGLASSSDGRYLAINELTKGEGKAVPHIALWDMERGKELARRTMKGRIQAMTLARGGERIAFFTTTPSQVQLWDLKARKLLHAEPISDTRQEASFSDDGKRLITAGPEVLRVWDGLTGRLLNGATGHAGPVTGLKYLPDGKTLLSAGEDGSVLQWDIQKRDVIRRFAHERGVSTLAVTADGKRLYTAAINGQLSEWDVRSGKEMVRQPEVKPLADGIFSLALSPGGKHLAAGAVLSAKIRLSRLGDGDPPRVLEAGTNKGIFRENRVRGLAFASAKILVARNQSGQLRVWDIEKGVPLHQIKLGISLGYSGLALSPDGRAVAAPFGRIGLGFWNLETGKQTGSIRLDGVSFTAVAYLPGGKTLAMGDMAGRVYLWDLERSRLLASFAGHRGPVTALAVAPDGRTFASGGRDSQILLWNAHAGRGD